MERMTHERANGIKTGYWSPATKEELVQRLGRLRKHRPRAVGGRPGHREGCEGRRNRDRDQDGRVLAGGIKDTVEAIHRDPDGFFKGGAR